VQGLKGFGRAAVAAAIVIQESDVRLQLIRQCATLTVALGLVLSRILAFAAESQPAVNPSDLLQRIREHVATHLSQLPNYTCHEVFDRFIRRRNQGSLDRVDRVELEVAFVANRELFAPTGGARFEEPSISKIVPVGTIGNGVFGAHADVIFASDAAEFKYVGPFKKDGHKTFRYDFQVTQEKSHFLLKHDAAQGIIAYKGAFWADIETLDLVRLELKADHIPSYLGVSSVRESMRYTMVRIGNADFLLPRNSELSASDSLGNDSLNMISLTGCRAFAGESVVTFGTPVDQNSADRQQPDR
jgi:hypothetical protein